MSCKIQKFVLLLLTVSSSYIFVYNFFLRQDGTSLCLRELTLFWKFQHFSFCTTSNKKFLSATATLVHNFPITYIKPKPFFHSEKNHDHFITEIWIRANGLFLCFRYVCILHNEHYQKLFAVKGTVISFIILWICVVVMDLPNWPILGLGGSHAYSDFGMHCSFAITTNVFLQHYHVYRLDCSVSGSSHLVLLPQHIDQNFKSVPYD